jgi:branched-subunit amino acid aminotransferase/4-amino-4-deoxychorismate lyase
VQGRWTTPPIEHGLLGGTLREELLRAGLVEEMDLTKDGLRTARALATVNSVRGLLTLRPIAHEAWLLESLPKDSDRDSVFWSLIHHVDKVMNRRTI